MGQICSAFGLCGGSQVSDWARDHDPEFVDSPLCVLQPEGAKLAPQSKSSHGFDIFGPSVRSVLELTTCFGSHFSGGSNLHRVA
jgi:hypothetical protein